MVFTHDVGWFMTRTKVSIICLQLKHLLSSLSFMHAHKNMNKVIAIIFPQRRKVTELTSLIFLFLTNLFVLWWIKLH